MIVFEHERLPIQSSLNHNSFSPQTTFALSLEQVQFLKKFERLYPGDFLRWGPSSVSVSNYCGVIPLGKEWLQILPKIFYFKGEQRPSSDELTRIETKSFDLLMNMLWVSQGMSTYSSTSASHMMLTDNVLLEQVILRFCDDLGNALCQGVLRKITCHPGVGLMVKGRMRPSARLSIQRTPYTVSDQKRWDTNLIENQCIKWVLETLLKKARSQQSKKKLNHCLVAFVDVVSLTDINELGANIHHTVLDISRLSHHQKPFINVFLFCRWFIDEFWPSIRNAKIQNPHRPDNQSVKQSPILFDMNRLFENAMSQTLRIYAQHVGLKACLQGPSRALVKRKSDQKSMAWLKPDVILMTSAHHTRYVIDFKWKVNRSQNKDARLIPSDLYQVLSYAITYRCQSVVLVYPMVLREDANTDLAGRENKIVEFEDFQYQENITVRQLQVNLKAFMGGLEDSQENNMTDVMTYKKDSCCHLWDKALEGL